MSILDLSILEIHEAYVKGETTPLEMVKEALKRAKEDTNNAFEFINEEEALKEAAALTEVEVDNPLWGIPYVCKDNFSTKGIPTTASSNILNGYVPLFDATVVERLKQKHCIMIAKSTLDELAMGGTGTTGHLGKTFNPYDPAHKRMIGGSSCGSAASVAAGVVPFALGSDTGDSVRKPGGFAGLVGFKPSWGRISRYGLFPFAPSLDHVGYFTRTSADACVLLNALAGRDAHDSTSSFMPVEDYLEEPLPSLEGKRIAVLKEVIDNISDPKMKAIFETSIKAMEKAGAKVDYVPFGQEALESIYPTYIVISSAEATSNDANLDGIKFGPYYEGKTYQEVMYKARTNGFSELIKRRFVIGSFALMRENQDVLFLRAQRNRAKIVERTNEILKDYDFIYAPTAPSIAPLFEGRSDKLSDEYLIADNYLAIGNFAGLPSITLPLGFIDGMPVGGSFTSRAYEEKPLLSFCRNFEELSGLGGLSINNRKGGHFE